MTKTCGEQACNHGDVETGVPTLHGKAPPHTPSPTPPPPEQEGKDKGGWSAQELDAGRVSVSSSPLPSVLPLLLKLSITKFLGYSILLLL